MARTNDETEFAQQNGGEFDGTETPTVVGDEDDEFAAAEAIADAILAAGTPDEHGIVWVDDPDDSPHSVWDLDLPSEEPLYSESYIGDHPGGSSFTGVYAERLPSGRSLIWQCSDIWGVTAIAVAEGESSGWAGEVEAWAEARHRRCLAEMGDDFWLWHLDGDESALGQGWPWHLQGAPDFSHLGTLRGIESREIGPELRQLGAAIREELEAEAATPERRLFLGTVRNVLDELWWLSAEDGTIDSFVAHVTARNATTESVRAFVIDRYRWLLDDNGVAWGR